MVIFDVRSDFLVSSLKDTNLCTPFYFPTSHTVVLIYLFTQFPFILLKTLENAELWPKPKMRFPISEFSENS